MNELQLQEWADTHTKKLEDCITELEKEVGRLGVVVRHRDVHTKAVKKAWREDSKRLTAEVARLDGLLKGWQTGQQEDAQTIENLTAALRNLIENSTPILERRADGVEVKTGQSWVPTTLIDEADNALKEQADESR